MLPGCHYGRYKPRKRIRYLYAAIIFLVLCATAPQIVEAEPSLPGHLSVGVHAGRATRPNTERARSWQSDVRGSDAGAREPLALPTLWLVPWHESVEAQHVQGCESSFLPWEVGDAGERGLFQIHPIHFDRFDPELLFDPEYNTEAAYALYLERGWQPWSCRP